MRLQLCRCDAAARLRILLFCLLGTIAASCVTLTHPRGAWFRPVTVPWSESTMKGVRVAILCGDGDRETDSWREVPHSAGCAGLSDLVKNMGATVVKASQTLDAAGEDLGGTPPPPDQPPDMTLVFIDRAAAVDRCWPSSPLVILTLSLFPCLEDVETRAELRILDDRGAMMRREVLEAHILNVYGLGALPLLAARVVQDEYPKALRRQRRLIQHLTDLIYTDRVRQNVAAADAGRGL